MEEALLVRQRTAQQGRAVGATARGTVKMAIARGIAIAAGISIHVYLARALEPELYGLLAVVTSIVVWWKVGCGALLGSSTAYFIARAGSGWRQVAGSAVQTAIVVSVAAGGALLAAASVFSRILGDGSLAGYIRLFSVDVMLYPIFTTVGQVVRGRRRYGVWAALIALYWTAKVIHSLSLGWSAV